MQNLEGFLKEIYPVIQEQVALSQQQVALDEMKALAAQRTLPVIDAAKRLRDSATPVGVIAEVKRASPVAGRISSRDIAAQAQAYVAGGAAAVSVLTEPSIFHGSLDDLRKLKAALPKVCFLRKDFIIDPYQVYESKAAGADMLLLLVKWLDDETLRLLYELTRSLGLEALVEVTDSEDMRRAQKIKPAIVGINARNLQDLSVEPTRVPPLAELLRGEGCIIVGESGVSEPATVRMWQAAGVHAVLVGEALMRAADPAALVREFSLAVD